MKKLILMSLFAATAVMSKAQMVNDSAVSGPSYRNNVWYSLENGTVDTVVNTNWDIAFSATASMTDPMTTSILVNEKIDSAFVTNTTVTNFASLTALDLANWTKLHNSDTSWKVGAFNSIATGHPDYGWGEYNSTSHDLEASKVFVVVSGAVAKKLYIMLNSIKKRYIFTYANLDNSNQHTDTINVDDYATKNFVYYSLKGDSVADREPAKTSWDLWFGQHYGWYLNGSTYIKQNNVTGVLHNNGVKVAIAKTVADTITNYSAYTFADSINSIGTKWKYLNGPTWVIEDSLVYFVKRANGDIWKMVFTNFVGAAAGKYVFSKEKLYTYVAPPQSVAGVNNPGMSMAMYPNPAVSGQAATVIYNLEGNVATANIAVYDMSGRTVKVDNLNTQAGLHQYVIPTGNLSAGIYIVNLNIAGTQVQQKLVIQ